MYTKNCMQLYNIAWISTNCLKLQNCRNFRSLEVWLVFVSIKRKTWISIKLWALAHEDYCQDKRIFWQFPLIYSPFAHRRLIYSHQNTVLSLGLGFTRDSIACVFLFVFLFVQFNGFGWNYLGLPKTCAVHRLAPFTLLVSVQSMQRPFPSR